ncbi:MAG: RidA family protein [Myxococcota bacterium]|nr:RidA family protein [Myxococcota bacterium]
MSKYAVQTEGAPAAIGPYSQAVVAGDTMWVSGQIALDPHTMQLVGETAAEQAVQVLKNLGAVLEAASFRYADLVQCTIYLTDMNDFSAINEVYARYMPTPPPARATVEVSRLPRDVKIEIGAVAKRG